MPTEGLRERKKARTRAQIVDAALELFELQGFERTTVADIAARADIAPRTFFGYFPSKEDVLFADFAETFDGLRAALEGRGGADALEAMQDWIVGLIDTAVADPVQARIRRCIRTTPALHDAERAKLGQFEDLLREHVARDLVEPADALRPRLVSSAAVACLSALEGFFEDDTAGLDAASARAIVEEAMRFLRGGLMALQDAP